MDSRGKVNAFFEEFEFLKELINPRAVKSVRVSRVDAFLLKETYETESFPNPIGGIDVHYLGRIQILDKNGSPLIEVGKKKRQPKNLWQRIFGRGFDTVNGEDVDGALKRLGEGAKNAFYVLSFRLDTQADLGRPYDIVLYKPPKGIDLPSWLQNQRQKRYSLFKNEIDAIDAEGQTAIV